MSEEKTEKPTKRKLQKARQEGNVAKSSSLAAAVIFLGGALLIWGLHDLFANRLQTCMRAAFSQTTLEGAFQKICVPLIWPLMLTLGGILLLAISAHLFQTGWLWAPKRLKPKWSAKKRERRLVFPLLQLAAIVLVGYLGLKRKLNPTLLFASSSDKTITLFNQLILVAVQLGALLLFLGLLDLFYQKWLYYKRMHMTPAELKEELRENQTGHNRH